MKRSDNTKNLGNIVIPKARGVPNSLSRVSTSKETEDISYSLPCIVRAVHCRFFSRSFAFIDLPGRRKGLKDKTYSAMDLLVHGEFNGASCILIEDRIRMLSSFY